MCVWLWCGHYVWDGVCVVCVVVHGMGYGVCGWGVVCVGRGVVGVCSRCACSGHGWCVGVCVGGGVYAVCVVVCNA